MLISEGAEYNVIGFIDIEGIADVNLIRFLEQIFRIPIRNILDVKLNPVSEAAEIVSEPCPAGTDLQYLARATGQNCLNISSYRSPELRLPVAALECLIPLIRRIENMERLIETAAALIVFRSEALLVTSHANSENSGSPGRLR